MYNDSKLIIIMIKNLNNVSSMFLVLLFSNCKSTQSQSFAYTITSKINDADSSINISEQDYISYNGILFEFKKTRKWFDEIKGNSTSRTIILDTTGIFLIKDKYYYEFNVFSQQALIVKKGYKFEKAVGRKYFNVDTLTRKESDYKIPLDTFINNYKLYYYPTKQSLGNDSFISRLLLIKEKKFTSYYKESGSKFWDEDFCMIGLHVMSLKNTDFYKEELTYFRRLTIQEEEICDYLVKRIK